jgi:NAD(P)-dependent dehydrogenase (short-subunit alcohol dehydrogenase family)
VLELGDAYPVPIRRVASPDEQAAVLAFLLSPESSYVVGTVIPVDGGGDAAARGDDWPSARP